MICNPKNGRCDFIVDGYQARASFLTDVPMEIADAFIALYDRQKAKAVVSFSGQLSPYDLILSRSMGDSYVMDFLLTQVHIIDKHIDDLLEEFLDDIERDGIDRWTEFMVYKESEKAYREKKDLFERKINQLQDVRQRINSHS